MPFTPFHFGPGAALKAIAPRHFSFTVFCFAQVVTDAEVLIHMARGEERLHGFMHTYLGAAWVGLFSFVVGWPVCQWLLRTWCSADVPLKEYYAPNPQIGIVSALSGALVGSFSHVFLDSLMHADLRPFFPHHSNNPLLGIVGPGALHGVCFVLGILGAWLCGSVRKKAL